MTTGPAIIGRARIAHALGQSERTVTCGGSARRPGGVER
jgi:hypothetical protein